MTLHINDIAPNFTPVCTTGLSIIASVQGDFDQRNTKIIGFSADRAVPDLRKAKQSSV